MMPFDFTADYILENERVLLRPLKTSDLEHLLPYALNEPETWHYNAPGAAGLENLKTYIEKTCMQRKNEREYPFIVFDKRTQQYAGSTRFYDIQPEKETIQLGFTWYGKAFRETGLNKNCKYLLLAFAFDKLGTKRVGFAANSKNEKSINAMKSIGCTVEGIMRSSGYNMQGERIDSVILSILQNEWNKDLEKKLRLKIDSK